MAEGNATSIAGATSASYTTPATTTPDSGSQYRVVVSNAPRERNQQRRHAYRECRHAPATTDVLTYHNDIARTGTESD
jgi:hypothetical protein